MVAKMVTSADTHGRLKNSDSTDMTRGVPGYGYVTRSLGANAVSNARVVVNIVSDINLAFSNIF